jgi:hypothetical protein
MFNTKGKNPKLEQRYKSPSGQNGVEPVYDSLYQQRRKKDQRNDRSPLDIEYEKQQKECIFRP